MQMVEADAESVESRLAAGEIACPGCGGELRPWGHARWRTLRDHGRPVRLRPRRSRCRRCLVTHVLLPVLVVVGYRIAMTPDRLLGRVESVRSNISMLISPPGPLAAGLLLESVSTRVTVAMLAVVGLVLALWGTFSPAIHQSPTLDDLPGPA